MKKTVPIIICLLITYLATAIAQNVAYNFTNKVTFTKSGNGHISKFIGMLPLPISNLYQDIANLTYSGGEEIVEGRYGNHVLMADRSDFPGSQYVMSSSFAIHPIPVKVDVSNITSIPDYDPNSEPCRLHLGNRREYIQAYSYWNWYDSGQCSISGKHEFYKTEVATGVESLSISPAADAYNLQGMKVSSEYKGIVISNGKKIYLQSK